MPDTFPPIPAWVAREQPPERKLDEWHALRRAAEEGQIRRPTSSDPEEDNLLALKAAFDAGANEAQLQTYVDQVKERPPARNRFVALLDKVGLPFEAFSEAVNALVGPVIPQEKFQERSASSRAVLKAMLGGDLSVAEAAGALREIYQQRSSVEQIVTGLLFDPLNLIVPGALGIKAGIKVGAQAGAKAGVKAGAQKAGISAVDWFAPFVGPKLLRKLNKTSAKRVLLEAAQADPIVHEDIMWRSRAAQPVGGGAGDIEIGPGRIVPRGDKDTQADLLSAANEFYKAVENPAQYADLPEVQKVVELFQAAHGDLLKELAVRLEMETFGRSTELGRILKKDIDWASRTIIIPFAERGRTGARVSVQLRSDTLELLKKATAGLADDEPLFTYKKLGVTPGSKVSLNSPLNQTGWNDFMDGLAAKATQEVTERSGVSQEAFVLLDKVGAGAIPMAWTRNLERIMAEHNIIVTGQMTPNDAIALLRSKVKETKRTAAVQFEPGETTRHTVTLAYQVLARRAGVDASTVLSYMLGHATRIEDIPRLLNIYAVRGGVSLADEALIRFSDPITGAFRPIQAVSPEAEALGARAARGAAGIQRKGKSTKQIGRTQEQFRGAAKLENLVWTPEELAQWQPLLAQIESAKDHDLLRAALLIIKGDISVRQLDEAISVADTVAQAKVFPKEVRAHMAQWAKDAGKEKAALLSGILAHQAGLGNQAASIRKVLAGLVAEGSITNDFVELVMTQFNNSFRAIGDRIKLAVAAASRYRKSTKIATKWLETHHLVASEAEWIKFRNLEQATPQDAVAAVKEWLDHPQIRNLLTTKLEIEIIDGNISMSVAALTRKLIGLGQGNTRHLLGADLLKPLSTATQTQARLESRVDAVTTALQAARRIDELDYIVKHKRAVMEGPRSLEEAYALLEPGAPAVKRPAVKTPKDFKGAWVQRDESLDARVERLIGKLPNIEDAIKFDNPTNPRYTGFMDKLREMGNHPSDNLPMWFYTKGATAAHSLLQFATLKGATASGALKTLMGHASSTYKNLADADVLRSSLLNRPGAQILLRHLESKDVTKAWRFADEYLNPDRFVSPVYRWLASPDGPIRDATGLLKDPRFTEDMALKRPYAAMFAGDVPIEELPKLYNMTNEELDFVAELRMLHRRATGEFVQFFGYKKAKALLNRPPSENYFLRAVVEQGARELKLETVGQRGFRKPGGWSKMRTLRDEVDAMKEQVDYWSPIEGTVHYVADMRRMILDEQIYKKMADPVHGYFTEGGALFTDRYKAARGLLRLATAAKEGKPLPLTSKEMGQLVGYASKEFAQESMDNKLGKMAARLLDDPAEAAKLYDDINKVVNESLDSYSKAQQLRSLTKGLPGLERAWFLETDDAQKAIKYMKEHQQKVEGLLRSANTVSSVLRMFQAGMDFSWVGIQGLVALTTDPKAWARTARFSWKVFTHPEVLSAWKAHNAEAIQDFISHTGAWETSEIFEAARPVSRFLGILPIGKEAKTLPARFESAFSAYLLRLRLELFEAGRPMARGSAIQLQQLANWANKMTGVYNPATAGLTTWQRYVEGTFISFAPMYRRAAIGLLVDAFRGVPGVTNRLDVLQAQKAIGKLMLAAGTYGAMLEFTGNNPDALNPASPKFLSARIPGTDMWLGIGSAYYSLVRAFWAVTMQAMDPDRRGKLAQPLNLRDNSLSRWWRSQAPPLMQAGIDIWMGDTYIGEPLRDEKGDPTLWMTAVWASKLVTPMTLESFLDSVRKPGDSIPVMGEAFGFRTFPLSLRDKFRNLANNVLLTDDDPEIQAWVQERQGQGKYVSYDQLPSLLKERLRRTHTELQKMNEDIQADDIRRGKNEVKERTAYFQETDANRKFVSEQMSKEMGLFTGHSISGRELNERLRRWQTASVGLSVRTIERYPDVHGWLEERKLERLDDPDAFFGDLLYDRFYSNVVLNPLNYDSQGNFQPRVRERLEREFMFQAGSKAWEYVQARRRQSHQYADQVQRYFNDRDTLLPYWRLHYDIWGEYSSEAETLDQYYSLIPREQDFWVDRDPKIRALIRRLRQVRENFRRKNPELDWLLVKWHDYSPVTELARKNLNNWMAS